MIGRPGPFLRRDRVVVDRHDQAIGLGGGGLEVSHVAHVQQIEAAVGEGDRPAGAAIGGHEVHERGAGHDHEASIIGENRLAQLVGRDRRGAALHATRPPA